jgi:hypothetical protein
LKQRHTPEEGNPQLYCCEKLKTRDWCCSCSDDDSEYFNDTEENGYCDRDVGGGGGCYYIIIIIIIVVMVMLMGLRMC